MAELADALDLGSSGRPWGFDSLYPHSRTATRHGVAVFSIENKTNLRNGKGLLGYVELVLKVCYIFSRSFFRVNVLK